MTKSALSLARTTPTARAASTASPAIMCASRFGSRSRRRLHGGLAEEEQIAVLERGLDELRLARGLADVPVPALARAPGDARAGCAIVGPLYLPARQLGQLTRHAVERRDTFVQHHDPLAECGHVFGQIGRAHV